ncbi:MAG: phage tail protein [Pseudomonas sp.]|uniref:phage tail protein n=1 Tax=Pseudomonas sp. TaxID=306 RepID=UPI00391D924A
MIDANSQFFAILTKVGRAKQANADALGIPWKITEMGVGDANDTDPIPNETQTRLINEWRRRPLNQLRVDPANSAVIIAEQIIPADEGGRWIREIGLYDSDGDLIAVANCAPSFKPMLSQGSGRTQVVRMNFIVSSTGNITLKIDPAVVLATREYVDQRILEELYKLDSKQSVRVATTGNIALAGLQIIDGIALVAGDRVLVKNQTVAKDNGLYIAAAGVWVRTLDADTSAEVTSALLVSVEQGATLADTRWQLVTDGLIVLGVTALTFQNVTQGFAPINSPALLGVPTAPTPPQFSSDKSVATTEFVQRSQGNYRRFTSLTAETTLTETAVGTLVTVIGTFNLTLPPASLLPSGGAIHFRNIGSGVVTVVCAGTDSINSGAGAVTTILLQPGATLELSSNGDKAWWAAGSAQLQYSQVLGSTPAQFDNSKRLVTAEFVQRSLGNFGGVAVISVSRALTAADLGKRLELAGGVTVTLPNSSSIPDGAAVLISAGPVSTTSRVNVAAGDQLAMNNLSVPVPYTLAPGGDFIAIREANVWRCHFGSETLRTSPLFAASLGSSSGYQKLPSGQIRYFGTVTVPGNTVNHPVTLPIAYLNQILKVILTPSLTVITSFYSVGWMNKTLNGFGITNPNSGSVVVDWETIGN